MACADTEDCNDPTYTTPVPVAPFPVAGGGSGGGGGGGGSCDCDPTSGSYPTSTTLSTDINGTTQVSLASCSGLSSSDVVLKETLIYDSDGTVGRVIAFSGGKLTVQTMTTAGDGAGSKSDGSYLTSTTLTTAFTGTTNVPQSSVTGLSPADVVINETLIFDGEGTVGRVIGISGSNYIVQTMTISPGERSGTRLGSVEKEANLPANCAAATALGWQTPISGDFAYVRDHDGHLAEFVATVDGSCNITWQWSHDLNAGDYLTGVKDQDGNPLPIDGDGMVTLPRESDGTYHSNTALNKSIGGTRNIALSATDISAVGDIVLNETLVYDDDGTVGKITNVSGTTLTIKTITVAGDGDASDGSYPTTATLDLAIGNSTTIGYATISGIPPIADIVINETLIYDGAGTLGRVISVNATANTVTVETMTTAGSQDTVSDGTYSTTATLDRTIGNTQTINISATTIANASDIMPGETLLFDAKGTMGRVDSVSGTGVLTVTTITTAGVSDGSYPADTTILNTDIGGTTTVPASDVAGITVADVVPNETLVYDRFGTVGRVTAVSGTNLTVQTMTVKGDPAVGVSGKWFHAYNLDGDTFINTGSRFWMLETNALKTHRGNLKAKEVTFPDPWNGSSQTATLVELPGPGVYYVSGSLCPLRVQTDNYANFFEYDPVTNISTWLGQTWASNVGTGSGDTTKKNVGSGSTFVEVPAGQVKYVGYVNIETGSDFWFNSCSFSVHSVGQAVEQLVAGDDVWSSDELLIGSYLGKPLYQKTFEWKPSLATDGYYNLGLTNAETVADLEVTVETHNGIVMGVDSLSHEIAGTQTFNVNQGIFANYDKNNDRLYFGGMGNHTWNSNDKYVVRIKYTKTTDAAGSAPNKNSLLLTRPDLWPTNTEIDFGGGLYGCRIAGTAAFTSHPTSQGMGTWLSDANCPVAPTGLDHTCHIVNSGGEVIAQDTYGDYPVFATAMYVFYQTSTGLEKVGIKAVSQIHNGSSATTLNADYDIWLTYTK